MELLSLGNSSMVDDKENISDLLCTVIIRYGQRKNSKCGLMVPCRYHKVKNVAKHPILSIDGQADTKEEPLRSPPSTPGHSSNNAIVLNEGAGILSASRKSKVTVRLIDKSSQQDMRQRLDECLRDRAVRKRSLPILQETYGPSCYYLRHTDARGVTLAQREGSASPQVDHTFECQLIAHAVVQCPDYTDILRQYDPTTRGNLISQQGFVVQGALRPVYDVQNNCNEEVLFNLRLLHPSINATKRHAYTNFLKHVYDVRRGSYNVHDDMARLLGKHCSARDAVLLSRSLLSEMGAVETPYVARLQAGIDPSLLRRNGLVSDRARVELRLNALAESVKVVFEDILDGD